MIVSTWYRVCFQFACTLLTEVREHIGNRKSIYQLPWLRVIFLFFANHKIKWTLDSRTPCKVLDTVSKQKICWIFHSICSKRNWNNVDQYLHSIRSNRAIISATRVMTPKCKSMLSISKQPHANLDSKTHIEIEHRT